MTKFGGILGVVLFLSQSVWASAPIALVYQGEGACPEGCAEAAAHTATLAGFEPRFVGPKDTDPSIFVGASIWIQPGGKSSTAAKAMAPALKDSIKSFIASGGGYVGYCAGGFIATTQIADRGVAGFGILPGQDALWVDEESAKLYPVTWEGKVRSVYYEGGPYFIAPTTQTRPEDYEIMATYPDGKIASVRTSYGLGRVYVTGLHPEAPAYWKAYFKLDDTDGDDFDLAVAMIKWASRN